MPPRPDAWAIFLPDGPPANPPLWEEETRPWSLTLVRHYLALLDGADGLVLDPFACHPALVLAAVHAGRRVLAVNLDPTRLLALRLSLSPPEPRLLDAAFSALADSLKGGEPLSRHLSDLYRASCPRCGKPVTADYFIWDADSASPVEKWTRCAACNEERLSPTTPEDRRTLEQVEPRGTLYWQLLSRLVGPQDVLAERAAQLLSLYTPRNRYALTELALRAEMVVDDADGLRALRGLLLACLERCHSVFAPGAPNQPTRPTRLRPPRRFVERNVWQVLIESYRALRARAAEARIPWTPSLRALLEAQAPLVLIQQATARALARALPAGSVSLVLTEPPRADAAEYALAYLWTGWLFGREATAALRSLAMPRSSPDWGWYTDALGGVLGSLREALHPSGKVVLAFRAHDDAMPIAILQASAQAGFRLYAAVAQPALSPAPYRFVLEVSPRAPKATPSSQAELNKVGREAALAALKEAGQPLKGKTLAQAILWAWSRQGLIAKPSEGPLPSGGEPARWWSEAAALIPDDALTVVGLAPEQADATRARLEAAWWFAQPVQTDAPLADRVESFVYEALCQREAWAEADLTAATYAAFPGLLTPPPDLIRAVISSYAVEESPGTWRLRPEDAPAARAAEQDEVKALLLGLGRRLGYEAQDIPSTPGPWWPCRVLWLDESGPARAFAIQSTATLEPLLASIGSPLTLIPHHVLIPGGRAALVAHKLQQVPGWAGMLAARGWQFLKNRHLRRLAGLSELDRPGFVARLGLDPIVEQPETQLSLF